MIITNITTKRIIAIAILYIIMLPPLQITHFVIGTYVLAIEVVDRITQFLTVRRYCYCAISAPDNWF